MAKGQKPDYVVKLPVNGVWHKLGAAWNNDGGTINIVLDVDSATDVSSSDQIGSCAAEG